MNTAIIVHGGAGAWKIREDHLPQAIAACEEAAAAGRAILVEGGAALDAVEAAVRILEQCPVLDAGRGSYLNAEGEIEMDAMIMDGDSLALGAVGAVRHVMHPISLARRIMSESEHTFLVAHGAEAFAQQIGFPRCQTGDLLVEHTARDRKPKDHLPADEKMGTVGAVALDANGNLAAATSTGGTRNKKAGRVGDSPLVGSGAYADNWTAAASATGYGEALMKVVISKRVCDFVGNGLPAGEACEAAIALLGARVQGRGGVIAVDARGNIGRAYNTDAMPHAYAAGQDPIKSSA
ncbi:MAG: isoaspartyl peptidase/L-asparaginase family protein [Chloroflexota bacterium]